MKLINCPKCGRLLKDEGEGEILCSRCAVEEGDPYKLVREYIYNHQGATILEVSQATGVSERLILKYLKEGRLTLLEKKSMLLYCEKCGASIDRGSICGMCLKEELQTKEKSGYSESKRATVSGFGRRRR